MLRSEFISSLFSTRSQDQLCSRRMILYGLASTNLKVGNPLQGSSTNGQARTIAVWTLDVADNIHTSTTLIEARVKKHSLIRVDRSEMCWKESRRLQS